MSISPLLGLSSPLRSGDLQQAVSSSQWIRSIVLFKGTATENPLIKGGNFKSVYVASAGTRKRWITFLDGLGTRAWGATSPTPRGTVRYVGDGGSTPFFRLITPAAAGARISRTKGSFARGNFLKSFHLFRGDITCPSAQVKP